MMTAVSHDPEASPKLPTMADFLYWLITGYSDSIPELTDMFVVDIRRYFQHYCTHLEECSSMELQRSENCVDEEEKRQQIRANRSNYRNSKRPPGSKPLRVSWRDVPKAHKKRKRNKYKVEPYHERYQEDLYEELCFLITHANQEMLDKYGNSFTKVMQEYPNVRSDLLEKANFSNGLSAEFRYDRDMHLMHIFVGEDDSADIDWSPEGHGHLIVSPASGEVLYKRKPGEAHGKQNFTDPGSQWLVQQAIRNKKQQNSRSIERQPVASGSRYREKVAA